MARRTDGPRREIREYTGDAGRVSAVLREAELAAVHMAALGAQVLAAAPVLRLVACARSGAVNVNLEEAERRGVVVCNAPGRNARAVAEFTVAMIIDITKGLARGHRDLTAAAHWRADLYRYDAVGEDLTALTVGLLGLGHVGRLLVPLLTAFGARVLACDPYVAPEAFAAAEVQRCSLEELLSHADVVSLHARHRPGSAPLLGARELAMMRRGAYLIQTARQPAARLRRPGRGAGGRPPRRRRHRRVPGRSRCPPATRCWRCPTSLLPRTSPAPPAAAPAPAHAWQPPPSPRGCTANHLRTE